MIQAVELDIYKGLIQISFWIYQNFANNTVFAMKNLGRNSSENGFIIQGRFLKSTVLKAGKCRISDYTLVRKYKYK